MFQTVGNGQRFTTAPETPTSSISRTAATTHGVCGMSENHTNLRSQPTEPKIASYLIFSSDLPKPILLAPDPTDPPPQPYNINTDGCYHSGGLSSTDSRLLQE